MQPVENEHDETIMDLEGVIDPDDPSIKVLPDGTIVVSDDGQ